jgi:cold shock CspA family protein
MQIPLEISYRDVRKSEAIENLIREKAAKLELICDYITSCRIAVERPHSFVKKGNSFRFRIDITVPPGHEVVVTREPGDSDKHDKLPKIIRDAFNAARKQLQELVRKQRKEVKTHPEQEVRAIVSSIYPLEGYGFIRTVNGREIYFHRNSILNMNFDELQTGMGVRFSEVDGEKGPQAASVQVIDSRKAG